MHVQTSVVDIDCTHIPYSETGNFSSLVQDYLAGADSLQPYHKYTPDAAGIKQAIADRSKYPVNRKVLVDVLTKQYEHLPKHDKVIANIEKLGSEDTFTICTAHQPNLLTGYLYFVYKILHAIKLADELNTLYTDKHFVPVYYMGSEDNDLEELGTFRYNNQKYIWDADLQKGAVGRMKTQSVKPLLNELFRVLGPPNDTTEELKEELTKAYLHHNTIAEATQYLVNELFGRFGLVIINPDDAALKQCFIPVMQDDLLNHNAYALVSENIEVLEEQYKVQAHPRLINLFYLQDGSRDRIEKRNGKWMALNTSFTWTEEELIAELNANPERFSPNVILRGIFQETILPNIAFIGGGAEVAYWMELKSTFDTYKIFFPVVLLRQSVQWLAAHHKKLRLELGFSINDLFKTDNALIRQYIRTNSNNSWQTDEEQKAITVILQQLQAKAASLDQTLQASAASAIVKIQHQIESLEKKMLRAEKRRMHTQLERINRLKNSAFPNNGLQERYENFISYYTEMGEQYFDVLYNNIQPLQNEFLVIEAK